MKDISFFNKILNLFNIIIKNKIYILFFIGIMFLCMILLKINKRKHNNKLFIAIYLILIGIIIYAFRSNLYKIYDYMMNNIFVSIYFPNIAIYLLAIIVTNIILVISITNKKANKFIKQINIIIYSIITFLLVLLLNIIKENKLNVYDRLSIYSNVDALTIIELTSIIFIIWMIYLILYRIIKYFIKPKIMRKENIINEPIKRNIKSKSYIEIEPPKVVKSDKIKINKPIIDKELNEYEKLLTIDDYKLLLNILKEEKEKEKHLKEEKELQIKEQNKFLELEKLYGSVN